jgi:hypothetical protein
MQLFKILTLVILFSIMGLANAPCGEMRPATEREISFYTRVMTTVEKSLPPGPMEWQVKERSALKPPALVAADAALRPFALHYNVIWVDVRREKLAAMDDQQSLRNLEKAEEERARAEAQQKLDKLLNEKEKAYTSRDLTATQALEREIENITVELQRKKSWNEKDEEKQEVEELRGTALRVTVDVNLFNVPVMHAGKEDSLVPVPAQVYRLADGFDGDGKWQEGSTVVFLGRGWKMTERTLSRMQAEEPAGLPSTRVYTLVVRVQGDRSRARDYIKTVDWLALEGLIFK